MSETATGAFTAIGPGDAIPEGSVVPHYLSDSRRRISVARVEGSLYVFDDICTCADEVIRFTSSTSEAVDCWVSRIC